MVRVLHLCPVVLSSYLARTEPGDVARVEKQTFVCTERKEDAVPSPREGVESKLGNWKAPAEMDAELERKFPGSMRGRTPSLLVTTGGGGEWNMRRVSW